MSAIRSSSTAERVNDDSVITTVLGDRRADAAGIVLSHEHVLVDASAYFQEDPDPLVAAELAGPLRIEALGHLRRSLVSSLADLTLDDDEVAATELARFGRRGGTTVCDVSCHGLRQPDQATRLAAISRAASIDIVLGTGAYVASHHPAHIATASEEQLVELFHTEIAVGVDGTDVRCGLLGEIGLSTPPTPQEITVLRAAAATQCRTGVAVSVHQTDWSPTTAHLALDILEECGVPLGRVVIGHIVTVGDVPAVTELLRRGCFVAYDTLGLTGSIGKLEFPTDRGYVERIAALVSMGFGHRLLLSHDVAHKRHLRRFGGIGYDHLLVSVLPMLAERITAEEITDLTVHNPMRLMAHVRNTATMPALK